MPSKSKETVAKTHSERVTVAGVRPATFKLVEWAADSFHLFRSSRKLGTAAAEGRVWSARFGFGGKDWRASADSPESLLKLAGTLMLASEAREAAARPIEAGSTRKGKGGKSKDEAISLEFLKRAQALRLTAIDAQIAECRKRVTPT